MKRTLLCFICIVIYTLIAANNQDLSRSKHSDTFPFDQMNIINEGLRSYLDKIPINSLGDYGIDSVEKLSFVTLGEAYKLYEINPDCVLKLNNDTTLADILSPTFEWFFPVLIDQATVAMLRVEQDTNGKAQVVSFGYAPLAKQIEHAKPDLHSCIQPALIVSYQAREFFLGYPSEQPTYLYDLQNNPQAKSKPDTQLQSILKRLQPIIRQNLQAGY